MVPTPKQKAVFKKVMTQTISVPNAMKEVGYSESFSENPQELTNSKGWQILAEKYISDDLILKRHNDLLNALDKDGNPDYTAIRYGVDMGYKVKGKYASEPSENSPTIQINITGILQKAYARGQTRRNSTL